MEFEQTPRPTALHRPLVAADPHMDPHRLVAVCCQHSGDEPLGVCLGRPLDHRGWLRRMVGPLFHWPHPRGRAA